MRQKQADLERWTRDESHSSSSGNRYRGLPLLQTPPRLQDDRRVTSTAPPRKPLPRHTLAEAAKHCAADDAWAVIDERAYDAARFVDKRPGGVTDVGCYRTVERAALAGRALPLAVLRESARAKRCALMCAR